jgi:hypothetical protein
VRIHWVSSPSRLLDRAFRFVEMVSRDYFAAFVCPHGHWIIVQGMFINDARPMRSHTIACADSCHYTPSIALFISLHFQRRVQSTLFTSAICLVKATILRRALSSRGADSASCM